MLSASMGMTSNFALWAFAVPLISIGGFIPTGLGTIGGQVIGSGLAALILGQSASDFITISLVAQAIQIIGALPSIAFISDFSGMTSSSLWLRSVKNKID